VKWPPDIPGLETPDFLVTVRGSFPPQQVVDAEVAEWREENAKAVVFEDPKLPGKRVRRKA